MSNNVGELDKHAEAICARLRLQLLRTRRVVASKFYFVTEGNS